MRAASQLCRTQHLRSEKWNIESPPWVCVWPANDISVTIRLWKCLRDVCTGERKLLSMYCNIQSRISWKHNKRCRIILAICQENIHLLIFKGTVHPKNLVFIYCWSCVSFFSSVEYKRRYSEECEQFLVPIYFHSIYSQNVFCIQQKKATWGWVIFIFRLLSL